MDYAAVEQNLGCVGDLLKDLESNVEFVVVVAGEGCHPGFDFLCAKSAIGGRAAADEGKRTCFRDMTSDVHLLPGSMVSSSLNLVGRSPTTPLCEGAVYGPCGHTQTSTGLRSGVRD